MLEGDIETMTKSESALRNSYNQAGNNIPCELIHIPLLSSFCTAVRVAPQEVCSPNCVVLE